MSKYQKRISKLVNSGALKLHGDRILVEVISNERKTASGIVLQEKETMYDSGRPCLCLVLAVGDGYYHEVDGEAKHVDLEVKVGDTIMVNKTALAKFADFFNLKDYKADSLALLSESLIHATVKPEEFETVLRD